MSNFIYALCCYFLLYYSSGLIHHNDQMTHCNGVTHQKDQMTHSSGLNYNNDYVAHSNGLNYFYSFKNYFKKETNNFSFKITTGVRFCMECHRKIKTHNICKCDIWQNEKQCHALQMKCKTECGVCLPNAVKRGRTWSECYDHSKDCKVYKDNDYCVLFKNWMKYVCMYTCGFCKGCEDEAPECKRWSEEGKCTTLRNYMLDHCRKSCNACECHDYNIYCKIWAENRQCEMNAVTMKLKCPLSCNVCGNGDVNKPVLLKKIIKVTTTTTTTTTTTKSKHLSSTNTSTLLPDTTRVPQTTTKTLPPNKAKIHKHKHIINDEHCGVPPMLRFRRIVGGDEIQPPRSWPWLVGITSMDFPSRVDCGGSLITNQFVMTAAHCFVRPGGMDPALYKIRISEHNVNLHEGFEIYRQIDRIYVHQNYDQNYDNDIAVLRLTEPVEFNRNIRPTCVADSGDIVKPGMACFVAGWGFQAIGVPGPPHLKIVKIPIVDLAECQLKYSLLLEQVSSRMICASGDGTTDSCEGDSGGPMVCRQPDGKFKQMGIVSWGVGCGQKDQYGVYTNVGKFRKWLEQLLESEAK